MKSTSSDCEKETPDFMTLETGRLDVMCEDENCWHTVNLRSNYEKPVVLVQIATYNGGHPVHPRVKDITRNSFSFKMEEWEYLDDWHTTETIMYVVAEAGSYELSCGAKLVVGTIDECHEDWKTVEFETPFMSTPTVMTQCQTETGPDAVVTRHQGIVNDQF
jgi:hypothetical protein